MGYSYKKEFEQFNHVPLEDSLKTGVYVIRHLDHNPDSVVYVGRATTIIPDTIRSGFRLRWIRHLAELRTVKCHHSPYLQNVCNKYGADRLRFDILEYCTKEESAVIETKWIRQLGAYTNGYNGVEESIGGTGFKMYEHVVDKIRKNWARYDLDGKLIDTWRGLRKIQTELKIVFHPDIYQDSSSYSAGGYMWRRYDTTPLERIAPFVDSRIAPVLCYSLDGKFIKKYDRMIDAVEETGVPNGNISKAVRVVGKNATHVACGYQWLPYTENYPSEISPWILMTGHQKRVKVTNLVTGEIVIYKSAREMQEKIGIQRMNVKRVQKNGISIVCRNKDPNKRFMIEELIER